MTIYLVLSILSLIKIRNTSISVTMATFSRFGVISYYIEIISEKYQFEREITSLIHYNILDSFKYIPFSYSKPVILN